MGMQRSDPVTGREVQAHQTPVSIFMEWGEDEPAMDRFNGSLKLSCFELHLGEAVEDLTRAQVPVLALEPDPVVESRGIAEREALQELATREAGRALELGKQGAMRLFRHGQRRVGRRTRRGSGFEEDEEVRYRKNIGALTQHVTQMEQGDAQGCAAMPRVPFWPELLGEFLARMDAAFHRQIDEEREFLARREQQNLVAM